MGGPQVSSGRTVLAICHAWKKLSATEGRPACMLPDTAWCCLRTACLCFLTGLLPPVGIGDDLLGAIMAAEDDLITAHRWGWLHCQQAQPAPG